ncbi:MAG: hypothetical protein ABI563_09140, partial [Specibacter sp.]
APRESLPGPWCIQCRTDEHLLIESVDESFTRPGELLEVSYTCLECESFCAREVPVNSLTPGVVYEFASWP